MLMTIPILITMALAELIFGVTSQEQKVMEAKAWAEYLRTMGR